ncbi:hypothetical protein F5884DRAFT_732282 [Xylogone sp. PMI_703]|nr:hypothetical protein F5884DRAFT_732282 [Xylogone sp. PMI_703]
MGGHAFSSLDTPRMPLEVYEYVRDEVHNALRQYYTEIATPIEAPDKTDFGDVDVLVAGPITPEFNLTSAAGNELGRRLCAVLKAKAWLQEKGNPTINLAISWPSHIGCDNTCTVLEKYIQVDVHMCLSKEDFDWELFHHAHGDMWNILGTTIRKFGLTPNDRGLFLRIPDIELYDRKRSMVFLSNKPREVLHFLGLDEVRWNQRFDSANKLYEFAAECRMFWVKDSLEDEESGESTKTSLNSDSTVAEGQEGGESGKKKLKHNDRQRMAKRPLFRQWVEDFIPKCRELKLYLHTDTTRESIREDAFREFGVQEEYAAKLREWNLLKHNESIWRDVIKERVPHDNPVLRGAAIKMLKAILVEGEEVDGLEIMAPKRDADGFFDLDEVRRFVDEQWEIAGRIRLARSLAKKEAAMMLK